MCWINIILGIACTVQYSGNSQSGLYCKRQAHQQTKRIRFCYIRSSQSSRSCYTKTEWLQTWPSCAESRMDKVCSTAWFFFSIFEFFIHTHTSVKQVSNFFFCVLLFQAEQLNVMSSWSLMLCARLLLLFCDLICFAIIRMCMSANKLFDEFCSFTV